MVVNPFRASRTTIHHSGCSETQGKSGRSGNNPEEAKGWRWRSSEHLWITGSRELFRVVRI